MSAQKYTLAQIKKAVDNWARSPVPETYISDFLKRQIAAEPERQCPHNHLERYPDYFKCRDCKVKFRRSAA